MSETAKKSSGFLPAVKEFFRKLLVSLKRKPQTIPLLMLAITFVYYSLNLTQISNTTAKIQGAGMGLCGFATMLFSILSLVCFMNAFPHRKKVNIPMLVLMFAMLALIIFCDYYYMGRITAALTRPENPIAISANTLYIAKAYNMLNDHVIMLIVSVVLVALLPIYSKLLKKIKTSIEVDGNADMGEIDISGED